MADATPIALEELHPGDELLQSALWGRFKERFGWSAEPVSWHEAGHGGTLLSLSRSTPLGPLVYVPGAPAAPPTAGSGNDLLLQRLAPRITKSRPVPTVVRYDLSWPVTEGAPPPVTAAAGLQRAPVDVQPIGTVLVDLHGAEERLLARMKPKTRYNIRLAERREVEVSVAGAAEALAPQAGTPALADWYRLYRATADRHRITAHNAAYFTTLFELAAEVESPELFLLSASCRGELLGGVIISTCGRMSRYLYGASAPRHRELMANYALQWASIRVARERRCRTYDLYGIPPTDDPNHPWAGLYRFKTGFGGTIVHRCGCWDYAMRPLCYRLMRQAELLRRRYYTEIRPRLRGSR